MRNDFFTSFISLTLVFATTFIFVPRAHATQAPAFPSCVNPQGTLIANYPQGIHGIVGTSQQYQGSDKVYKINENQVLQCFCAVDGNGIQTNWLKATQFSENDIASFTAAGWIYIPSGSSWGLDEDPYLAKNSSFSCIAQVGGTSSSSDSSSSSGTGGGSNDSTSIKDIVLGLAFTGNAQRIVHLWLGGLLALIGGLCIKLILKNWSKES